MINISTIPEKDTKVKFFKSCDHERFCARKMKRFFFLIRSTSVTFHYKSKNDKRKVAPIPRQKIIPTRPSPHHKSVLFSLSLSVLLLINIYLLHPQKKNIYGHSRHERQREFQGFSSLIIFCIHKTHVNKLAPNTKYQQICGLHFTPSSSAIANTHHLLICVSVFLQIRVIFSLLLIPIIPKVSH